MDDSLEPKKLLSNKTMGLLIFLSVGCFWILFSLLFESFYRDDNVGGISSILIEVARKVLSGTLPTNSEFLGGGGGAYILWHTTGILDPIVLISAMLLHKYPELMMNIISSLHLAFFALGGWYMALAISSQRWAAMLTAYSLAFCGNYFIWVGNWAGLLFPFSYLPWLIGALLRIVEVESWKDLMVSQLVANIALLEIFMSSMLFAAYYGGIVITFVMVAMYHRRITTDHRRIFLRLIPLIVLLLIIIFSSLLKQLDFYSFLGGRTNHPDSWVIFSVPIQGYLGLFIPMSYSIWQGPFYPNGKLFTNILLTIGIVPPWYLLITLIRKPRLLARPKILLLLIGLLLMVVVLSPGAFGLQGFFAAIPLLNAFRWPFRAIPAFHLLLLVLFLCVVVEEKAAPGRLARLLLLVTCVGGSLVSIGHDLALAAEPSRVASWYRAAPMLDDPESWSPPAMERLRKAGFVANVCGHDGRIHMKPRLFFYGNMGAMFGVRTLHLYAVPPFKAYAELDMSIKGCCKRWEGVKKLIEQGPQAPLQGEVSWADPRGPLSFAEVVAKTYIGAVVVDVLNDEAMRYFTSTEGWELVEARATASAFVRRKAEGR